MRYALIANEAVHSVLEYKELPDFAPNIVLVELPEDSPVEAGWAYIDGEFVDPEPITIDWPGAISARRWQAEGSGIEIDGVQVDTSRESQGLITGAAVSAMLDPNYSLRWKCVTGEFISLTAGQVLDLATAVRQHVQACFDREADLLDAVEDGEITAEMLEEGWP